MKFETSRINYPKATYTVAYKGKWRVHVLRCSSCNKFNSPNVLHTWRDTKDIIPYPHCVHCKARLINS